MMRQDDLILILAEHPHPENERERMRERERDGGYDGVYVRSAGAWVVGVGMVEWFG